MNETWANEMERSVGHLIEAVKNLVYSDAVQGQPVDVLRGLEESSAMLGKAIDTWEPSDPS